MVDRNLQGSRKRKVFQRYSPPKKHRNQASRLNQVRTKKNQGQSVKGRPRTSICLDPASTGQHNSEVLKALDALKNEMQQLRAENSELKIELANIRAGKENFPFLQQPLSPMLYPPTTMGRAEESEALKLMRLIAAIQLMNYVNGFLHVKLLY